MFRQDRFKYFKTIEFENKRFYSKNNVTAKTYHFNKNDKTLSMKKLKLYCPEIESFGTILDIFNYSLSHKKQSNCKKRLNVYHLDPITYLEVSYYTYTSQNVDFKYILFQNQ